MSSEIVSNLVKKAKNGSADAFGELYGMYAEDLFRFAYYSVGSVSAAEDCVSEAVCLAFQNIAKLKKNEAFKSWMFKILHNCCKNAQKIKYLRKDEIELSAVKNLSAEEKDHSDSISLMNALKKLSDEEKEIMILYYASGYNSKEIGEILGLKDSTVRSKIKRATSKLREMLYEDGDRIEQK